MAPKGSLASSVITDLLDQDDDECKEIAGEQLKAEAIRRREAELQRQSGEIYQDLIRKLKDVENKEKKGSQEDEEKKLKQSVKRKRISRMEKRSGTSCKSVKVESKSLHPDPFNEVADRSVDKLREIMNRKKPPPGGVYSFNPFQPIWQPNPTVMARWILEDLKAPQLKAHIKANWHLVKAGDGKGVPIKKKPIIELLIPVLALKIESDRVDN